VTTNDQGRRNPPPRAHETYVVGRESKRLRDELRRIDQQFAKAMQQRDNLAGQVATLNAKLKTATDALDAFAAISQALTAFADQQPVTLIVEHPLLKYESRERLTVHHFRTAMEAMS